MSIHLHAEGIELPQIDSTSVTTWITETAKNYGYRCGSIHYIFCNDQRILEVNRQFLQHDYYTDIITFDYTQNGTISGDLFISIETVSSNAELVKESFQRELLRVIIHGILHLCGLEDKSPEQEKTMRAAEEQALQWWK